jgi:glycosidase
MDEISYWLELGIDGFRFDMAEMVPVEFWSYMNSAIKMKYPKAFLLAEVYNPALYREYLNVGKLDYLYDKVGLYDTLKPVIQGHLEADHILYRLEEIQDIEHSMLHFLENHDEQRIASPEFAGNAAKGKPAMVVSATVGTSPTMIYFGQEVGEPAAEKAGFGSPSRTSIFDYIGVPHHQRWVNKRQFDGGQLSDEEKSLHVFYQKLLNFTIKSPAMMGGFQEIHHYNRQYTPGYDPQIFSFLRWSKGQKLLILVNFNSEKDFEFELKVPSFFIQNWGVDNGEYLLTDQLDHKNKASMTIQQKEGRVLLKIGPLGSFIYELSEMIL